MTVHYVCCSVFQGEDDIIPSSPFVLGPKWPPQPPRKPLHPSHCCAFPKCRIERTDFMLQVLCVSQVVEEVVKITVNTDQKDKSK